MKRDGADADAFDAWWNRQGPWVESQNLRRGGSSGVQILTLADGRRCYSKRQEEHTYRSLRYPLGRPTVLRERDAYLALGAIGVATPKLVYAAARRRAGGWQAILVTEALEGLIDLEAWYGTPVAAEEGPRHAMLEELARQVARMHAGGWQHGCLYAKHVFVRCEASGAPQVVLIDLEKCRRRRPERASRRDIDQLRRRRGAMPEDDWRFFVDAYSRHLAEGGRRRGTAPEVEGGTRASA
ncbi:MAG: lipopolysaccharide kinase InaA family protein [Burkholderiales bacterium]|nr:lipopolysaccharide kinase InaA family protein [Burkholderiales bacterium]